MNFADMLKLLPSICAYTSVRKRWERAFGICSNCICSRTDYIKNVVTCVEISRNLVASLMWHGRFSAFFPCVSPCCGQTTQVGVDLNRYMSSTMSCLRDRTKNCGDLRFYLFENVVFVKSVAPITRLSYIPCCLLIYITLSYIVGQCSLALLVAYNVTSPCVP